MNLPLVLAVCVGMSLSAVAVLASMRVSLRWEPIIAILRAGMQLALLALVLQFIVTDVLWVLAFLVLMVVVASITAARRIDPQALRHDRSLWLAILFSISLGLSAAVLCAFATGAVTFGTQYLLALGGIVTGNVMSICTLTGKHLREQLQVHRGEVEGWLALGATAPVATVRFRRASVKLALIPGMDSAKTTGLVTLPGAFVGAVFAGASPVDAGLFQLIVLAGLQLGGAITATTLARCLASRTS